MDRLISEQQVLYELVKLIDKYGQINHDEAMKAIKAILSAEPNITWVTGADGAKIAFKDVPVWKVTKICEILGEPQERSEE